MDLTNRELRRSALFFDPSFSRLETIIEGLNNGVRHLYNSELCIDWYGTMNEKSECETIYRLAILAFETYIITSATSLCKENENPQQFYNLLPDITLILNLADYITLKTGNYEKIFKKYALDVSNYPIYNGIRILDEDRNLIQITKVLKSWRNQIVYIQYPVDPI
ncbi:hypothetical protein [Chryseobacterium hagamense]|uniref:Uncharacterized protein n=1 Tax=Chryseobacterium hagamense TaxID=395935 RepID=A0A511YHC3_9FLAO|nr:hypothetical protein [Chryseobacterium hagamense]GEN74607.1 hypothetical protein CHA01nite_03470 [Chryseobacterium hagamense]